MSFDWRQLLRKTETLHTLQTNNGHATVSRHGIHPSGVVWKNGILMYGSTELTVALPLQDVNKNHSSGVNYLRPMVVGINDFKNFIISDVLNEAFGIAGSEFREYASSDRHATFSSS